MYTRHFATQNERFLEQLIYGSDALYLTIISLRGRAGYETMNNQRGV